MSKAHHHHGKNIYLAMLLITSFAIFEALAGLWSGSLALLSDAAHMATDVVALGMAAFAVWLMQKPASKRHSFGLGRIEVIAALLNALFNIAIVIPIGYEAIMRLYNPQPVDGLLVSGVSIVMLLVTSAVFMLLHREQHTLNTRGVLLHIINDLLGSVAALIAGLVIYFTGWMPIDPILSLLICVLILASTVHLIRDTLRVLMEGVPAHLELKQVHDAILGNAQVKMVSDLHIWTLSSGSIMLTAHVCVSSLERWEQTLAEVCQLLADEFDINHITLQPRLNEQDSGCYCVDDLMGSG